MRATAVGLATALSRVGAALGTFVTPILLESAGVGTTLLLSGLVSALGVIVAVAMAPETRGRTSSQASS